MLTLTPAFAGKFPTPVAGSYYPIYNSGTNQYIEPTLSMPFNKISTLFIAFAHAYPAGNGAILNFEESQPDEINRLPNLVSIARQVNPKMIILITLGWGHDDWTYINTDYVNNANVFVPSVIAFIREYHLDGFDIDDEAINGSSGSIPQENFDAVIHNLRIALDQASQKDHRPYYLTITPADLEGNLDQTNMNDFDLINPQNYGGSDASVFLKMGYPPGQITQGIDTENDCYLLLPNSFKMAGIYNWSMSADSNCKYSYTHRIASAVGYNLTGEST